MSSCYIVLFVLSNRIATSASFYAEMVVITYEIRHLAEIIWYSNSPSKVGSVRQPTKIVMSRPTCRYSNRQFFNTPGTVSVCIVIVQDFLVVSRSLSTTLEGL